ncbi:MAG: tetratricopeptide repeat protein, partial [Cyanobacteria bacterium P01_D01_bin.115]
MLYKLSFTIGLSYIAFLLPISISALKPTSIPPFFKIEGIVAFAQETTDAHFVEAERLNQQGIQQFNSGQVYQALEIFQQELELRRQLGDRAGEGGVLNNIGSVYDALGQYQEALSFYEEALIIRQTIGDQRGEGESFNNIGSIYD